MGAEAELPFRILPEVTDRNRFFWTGGEQGELRFLRCDDCRYYIHPPTPICPQCHSKSLTPEAVSGDATLHTYSVNHQAWMPGPELPYVVAIVEVPEQDGLRLTTNLVNCAIDDVEIGMPVRVTFEARDEDVWIPLFEPRERSGVVGHDRAGRERVSDRDDAAERTGEAERSGAAGHDAEGVVG